MFLSVYLSHLGMLRRLDSSEIIVINLPGVNQIKKCINLTVIKTTVTVYMNSFIIVIFLLFVIAFNLYDRK